MAPLTVAAHAGLAFDQRHVGPVRARLQRRGQAGQAAAKNDDPAGFGRSGARLHGAEVVGNDCNEDR